MKIIYKYPLQNRNRDGACEVFLPAAAEILTVGAQEGTICLWALDDVLQGLCRHNRTFFVIGTGHEMPECEVNYIGTVFDGPFVWHVFEKGKE